MTLAVEVDAETATLRKAPAQMAEEKGTVVIACSLLSNADSGSGIFGTFAWAPPDAHVKREDVVGSGGMTSVTEADRQAYFDEDDALLYGEEEEEGKREGEGEAAKPAEVPAAETGSGTAATSDRHSWLFVCLRSGSLRVYELPSFTLRFECKNFVLAHRLLTDYLGMTEDDAAALKADGPQHQVQPADADPAAASAIVAKPAGAAAPDDPVVKEIIVVGLGAGTRPHLVALMDSGHLVV